MTWIRSPTVSRLVDSPPALLYYRGRFLRDAMRRERITESELASTIRKQGLGSLEEVDAVILESDGRYAVIRSDAAGDGSSMEQVRDPSEG